MSLIASMDQLTPQHQAPRVDRSVCLLAGTQAAIKAGQARLNALLSEHWPEPERPGTSTASIADLLGRRDVLEALRKADSALLVANDSDSAADLRAVAALLNEHSVPLVAHLPASLAHLANAMQSMGAMVHLQGRGDGVLAALLAGLSRRQSALREMEVELRSRRAAQKQVHSWVSKVDNELLLAAKLQRELMRCDDFNAPGLSVGVIYRPAWYVSGDVYRTLRVDEQHAGFLIADAMGHGISAAMYGMIIANGLNMKEHSSKHQGRGYSLLEPAESLTRINRLLLNEESDQTRFASAVCARVNVTTGKLVVSSAGHPPAMLFSPGSHKARQFDSTGPVLGVFGDSVFEQHEAQLSPGDSLVVYTDGFGEIVGDAHVEEYLAETLAASGGDVQRASAQIERFLDARPGSLTPADDATVLIITRAAAGG